MCALINVASYYVGNAGVLKNGITLRRMTPEYLKYVEGLYSHEKLHAWCQLESSVLFIESVSSKKGTTYVVGEMRFVRNSMHGRIPLQRRYILELNRSRHMHVESPLFYRLRSMAATWQQLRQ